MERFASGYRTKLGALGLAGSGVAKIVQGLTAEPLDWSVVMEGVTLVSAALAALGIRFAGKK